MLHKQTLTVEKNYREVITEGDTYKLGVGRQIFYLKASINSYTF